MGNFSTDTCGQGWFFKRVIIQLWFLQHIWGVETDPVYAHGIGCTDRSQPLMQLSWDVLAERKRLCLAKARTGHLGFQYNLSWLNKVPKWSKMMMAGSIWPAFWFKLVGQNPPGHCLNAWSDHSSDSFIFHLLPPELGSYIFHITPFT